jgi:hypothetical protein
MNQQGKIAAWLTTWFGANWRTTLIGLTWAIYEGLTPILQKGSFDFKKDWPQLVKALFIAVVFFFVKDKNVTGGTVNQNVTGQQWWSWEQGKWIQGIPPVLAPPPGSGAVTPVLITNAPLKKS